MVWTLRRILIVIVILSSLAVAGTLYWVAATYERFAISSQDESTGSTVSHLVLRQMEDQHRRAVNPFVDEWSRLSTLVEGMKQNDTEKARLAANRMMVTREVVEGRVHLRNVVVYSKEMQVVAMADKGTGETLSALPTLVDKLRARDTGAQRQITSFLWRGLNGRPLYSTIAAVGGFQAVGFIEFVSDPIPDLAGVGDAVGGRFGLQDIHGTTLFDGGAGEGGAPQGAKLDTLQVPIPDSLGGTWAVATLTRDVSAFRAQVSDLRNQALAIVAAVVVGSVLVGWLMLRLAVFSRLKDFAAITGMLAEGHTDVQIPSVGPDELAIMRTSLQSLRDAVSERQKATLALSESEKLQRIILDNVGQGILVFHANARPALWNDLATKFTGLSSAFLEKNLTLDQCNQFQFSEFDFDDETIELVDDFERRRLAGECNFVVSYQRRGIAGNTWVQVSLRLLHDGMVVQTYQDITDLRRAIDAAKDAQRLAERANRAKSDFLSNMSHELRTPLNAIVGFTEFIVENDAEPLTQELAASLSQVLKAGRHLVVLVNDVLDLAKIEAGAISLSIQAIDAGQVIDECVSLTSSFAARRNVTVHNRLEAGALPPIEADRIRFKQVFLNLLSNAIKYNHEQGNVYIEPGAAERGLLRVGVRDDGPGISEVSLKRLFEPFERLGAENSTVEGTGIGLTITKNLVDQMGGKISVESVVGEGSSFWLDMPISERAVENTVTAEHNEPGLLADLEGVVLYIEDNPANLELVRKIMSRQPGVDFIDAPSGEIGIERARTELPDVILLDINLPGMDGFTVLETLSAMPETRHIPVIALTAAATDSDIMRGQAAGFFSYLTKPISARDLIATIRRALNPSTPASPDDQPIVAGGKVLVVDDVPINLAVAQKQLTKLGIPCEIVADPVRALEMLSAGGYALALVDIGMPILNGIELTRRLRESERRSGRYTPVVALTADFGSEEDIARYRRAGMDGQLTKPVVLNELALTLRRWFSASDGSAGPVSPMATNSGDRSDADEPPIDMAEFKEILGSDEQEIIREMFDLFITLIPGELENLSKAIATRDKTQSREAAHRFKSAARNAAAGRLSDLLQEVEKELQNGCWDVVDQNLHRIREECTRVAEYMLKA